MDGLRTLVVLQPTSYCNINCTYCYLPHRSVNKKMGMDVLEAIAKDVFASRLVTPPIDFLWHLGEPLAVPVSYYDEAFSIINEASKKNDREFSFSFQTNAMLINEKWIASIRKHNIHIGVSIDGPEFIHDKNRIDRKNLGTHAEVMKGVRMLQEADIPFSVIMVVTKNSLAFPDEICDFFIENNINNIGFNIDEMEGVNSLSSFDDSLSEAYRQFIRRLFHRSSSSGKKLQIREFHQNIMPFTAVVNETFNTTNKPFRIFNFDADGNYSTYCPELLAADSAEFNNFFMGNILKDGLDAIQENVIFKKVKEQIDNGVELCRQTCDYFSFCG